jgi:hypothetical protein
MRGRVSCHNCEPEEKSNMKKSAPRSALECEYLVGEDTCRVVKENDLGALRADKCRNETKDACCYLCDLRRDCDISCDLIENSRAKKSSEKVQPSMRFVDSNSDIEWECGNCVYYLKPKCPRGYNDDTELWKRQDPCDIFRPIQKR